MKLFGLLDGDLKDLRSEIGRLLLTADEVRAVQCGANALRVAAKRVASYDDQRDMELMADKIEAMLDRLG